MSAKKEQLNVLTNNSNNNDDAMVSLQKKYQIDEYNRKEEKSMKHKIQCAHIVKSIHELKGN